MTIGTARYKTLSLDEDLSGIDDIPTTCVQDCILLAFKRLQEQYFKTGQAISNSEPSLDQFAESIDLLFTHRLKTKRNSFWNVAKEISCRDVIDTLSNLPFVCTNLGRARAWIYQALQDGLLSCYMAQIEKDVKLLNRFYRPNAAIRDLDFMFAVNNLLSGLDVITFNIIIDCGSFDSGQAPSSVKRTLFGSVVDDLSLSTAADAIALQIPQIFKKFSSNSSINGSHSSLNTIDSNESSQPSLETTDTHSVASFGEATVNQRKYQFQRMRKKPLKQKRSSVDRGSGATARSTSTEQIRSRLSDVRETLSESPPCFGTLKENKSEDVLMLMASKLREQAGDEGNISDISVRRVLERDAGVSSLHDNSPRVEDLLKFGLPNISGQNEIASSSKSSRTVVERNNEDCNSSGTAGIHRSSNPEAKRGSHHSVSLDKYNTASEPVALTNFHMDLPTTTETSVEKQVSVYKSGSNSSKSSSNHSFDRSSLPCENDICRTSSVVHNSFEQNAEAEKPRDEHTDGREPRWEFSASFMSKFDQMVELSYSHNGDDNPDTIGLSDDGAHLRTLPREPSDECGNESQQQFSSTIEKSSRLPNGNINVDETSLCPDSYDTSPTNTSTSKHSPTEDCDNEFSRSNHNESSSVEEGAKKGLSSSGSFSKYQSDISTYPGEEEGEDQTAIQSSVQTEDINDIASALSPTVYLDQNAVAFNKCDIFIDHMTQLTFELKVYQFNNDGDEQAIKLYRGFYRHMEMPNTWTHKSYHARPIDLLITNKAIYILKFVNEKATSLHYFFPLDEITLISVYPFGQGLKIYSRRSRKTDWAKLTVNDNRRTSEFWFETGDENFTQMIIEKLHQVIALHVETCNLPSFGDTALMETVQLRKLMALTFNYEEHNDVDIQRFFLLHMGECPFLSVSHERERSVSCLRADSVLGDPNNMEGMLWLKQESSTLGSIVKKSSHGIASLPTFAMHSSSRHKQETPVWKDFLFSIQQGIMYKAEYSENGKMGKAEPFITLSDCQSCVIYKDDDKVHTFCVAVSRSYFGGLFQSRSAKRNSDVIFYFAAKSEREQHNWINAINEFNVSSNVTSSIEKKAKQKSVPIKACAMVMDKKNAVICRYERETDEFFIMDKFSFLDVLRLILPDKNETPTFCVLDFKITEKESKEEDDFEIVENTALVDNLQPMCLYFSSPEECSNFISLLLKNEPSITSVPYFESGSDADVYKQLRRSEVELKKYRKIYKL